MSKIPILISIRNIAQNAERYHPYHYTKVQALTEPDFPRRVNFCTWLQQEIQNDPNFTNKILWTDESLFTRDGIFNVHNYHYWAVENPHVFRKRGYQHRFSVNVWSGILGRHLLGPIIIPNRMNHINFLNFCNHELQDFLDNIPLIDLRNIWVQLDGAPVHYALPVRRWLNQNFPEHWIGRGGPVQWPPRSPDLNPLDFFFWGHMKDVIYFTAPDTREELIRRINNVAETITPEMLNQIQTNIARRINACLNVNGRQFEHLL